MEFVSKSAIFCSLSYNFATLGLYDDTDFKQKITREEFETMIDNQFVKALSTVDEALKISEVAMADLHGVEVVGGG